MMKRLYFGHPKGVYHTPFARAALRRIGRENTFADHTIVDPSEQRHDALALGFKLSTGSESSMPYFLAIASSCDVGVFLLLPNGFWAYGTHMEGRAMLKKGRAVWSLSFEGEFKRIRRLPKDRGITKEETTEWNKVLRTISAGLEC